MTSVLLLIRPTNVFWACCIPGTGNTATTAMSPDHMLLHPAILTSCFHGWINLRRIKNNKKSEPHDLFHFHGGCHLHNLGSELALSACGSSVCKRQRGERFKRLLAEVLLRKPLLNLTYSSQFPSFKCTVWWPVMNVYSCGDHRGNKDTEEFFTFKRSSCPLPSPPAPGTPSPVSCPYGFVTSIKEYFGKGRSSKTSPPERDKGSSPFLSNEDTTDLKWQCLISMAIPTRVILLSIGPRLTEKVQLQKL